MNLSRSGIGVLVGVPGFRVGSGPRATTSTWDATASTTERPSVVAGPKRGSRPRRPPHRRWSRCVRCRHGRGFRRPTPGVVRDGDLIDQLNDAARYTPLWGVALGGGLVLAVALQGVPVLAMLMLLATAAGAYWVKQRDDAKRSVVVFYDIDDGAAKPFADLVGAFEVAGQSLQVAQVAAEGALTTTQQVKTHSGAGSVIDRVVGRAHLDAPRHLVTNVAVPTLEAKARAVAMLPDRLLFREGKRYGGLPYASVSVSSGDQNVIMATAPRDGEVVGSTWKYVNVKGGPDKRYKDNPQLPIVRFGELEIEAPEFRSVWQLTRREATHTVRKAMQAIRVNAAEAMRPRTARPPAARRSTAPSATDPTSRETASAFGPCVCGNTEVGQLFEVGQCTECGKRFRRGVDRSARPWKPCAACGSERRSLGRVVQCRACGERRPIA